MKKRSILSKVIAVVLTLAFVLTAFTGFKYEAKAATDLKDYVPTSVRIYTRSIDNSAIRIQLVDQGYSIKNIKSNNPNLKVYGTRVETSTSQYSFGSEFAIGCYARKDGKYKVTYTLEKNGKKEKKSVTVYAKMDSAIKSVKFGSQRLDLYGEDTMGYMAKKDSGKFSVKMNKGYKLKGIRVGVYAHKAYGDSSISSEMVYTDIANNSNVTLSDVPYRNFYESQYSSYGTDTEHMVAETRFEITYIDKYSKEERTLTYTLYKLVRWAE